MDPYLFYIIKIMASRFYKNVFPDEEDCVMTRIVRVDDVGIYAELLEYNNIRGFVSFDDVSKTKILSKAKYRVNQMHIMQVVTCYPSESADSDTVMVDLSTKFITSEQRDKAKEKYEKNKHIHSILEYIASFFNCSIEQLSQELVWIFTKDSQDEELDDGINIEDLFKKLALSGNLNLNSTQRAEFDLDRILNSIYTIKPNLNNDILSKFVEQVQNKYKPKPFKINSIFELTCFGESGIDGIKETLKYALNGAPNYIKINLKSSPEYVMTHFENRDILETNVIKEFNIILDKIDEKIRDFGGELKVIREPMNALKPLVKENDQQEENESLEEF